MKILIAGWFLFAVTASSLSAAPQNPKPPRHNRAVAFLAGAALHLAQDARALQSASTRKREKAYGLNNAQVKAGHKNLRVIRRKQRYFRYVKRRSEGREPLIHRWHPHSPSHGY